MAKEVVEDLRFVPGPLFLFVNILSSIALLVGLFFFVSGVRLEDDFQNLTGAGIFFFILALFVFGSNLCNKMEIEVSSAGVIRKRKIIGRVEIIEIPFSEIIETEVLPLSKNLKITLRSGKSYKIIKGIVEESEKLEETSETYAELHLRTIKRIETLIKERISKYSIS